MVTVITCLLSIAATAFIILVIADGIKDYKERKRDARNNK